MEEKLCETSVLRKEPIEITKKGASPNDASPPEFLVRRNEIFKKRSISVENDSVGGAPAIGGPLKGEEIAQKSLYFKGVHPCSKTGIEATSHFSRKLSDSWDYQQSCAYRNSGDTKKKEVRTDGLANGGGGGVFASENKPVTLLGRYVVDRARHELRAPALEGLGLAHSYLHRNKMGEDSNVDIAAIKDGSSPDSEKVIGLERHLEGERKIGNKKAVAGVLSHGASKIMNGVDQGLRSVDLQEQEFSYGPGFVDKLKSRFISLSLNDKNKSGTNLRRFSSLENVLDSDSEYNNIDDVIKRKRASVGNRTRFRGTPLQSMNSFKRAKSMETLLLEPESRKPSMNGTSRSQRPFSMTDTISGLNFINENVVIIEKTSGTKSENTTMVSPQEIGCLGNKITKKRDIMNRQVSNISDEELPKPDTVKTYKLFFEPGGKRPSSNVSRRSPVARHCAKNNVNNKSSLPVLKNSLPKFSPCVLLAQSKPSAKENVIVNGNALESQEKQNIFAKESLKPKSALDNDNVKVKRASDLERKNKIEPKDVTSNGYGKMHSHSSELSPSVTKGKPVIEGKQTTWPVIPIIETKCETPISSTAEKKVNLSPQVSSKESNASIPVTEGRVKMNAEENDKPEKPITFQKPESETGFAQQQLLPPTPSKEAATQNKMEISSKGPVLSPSHEINASPNENADKVASKSTTVNTSLSFPATEVKNEPEDDVLKPSALLGNKKSGLWQKNPQSQMTTTFVYNFVGKDVKSHLPANPAPFGCKPVRSKKKARDFLENKEGLTLKNTSLDLGDFGGESNDYDDEVDELDIGANLPAVCGITFVGENIPCSKSSLLANRNKKHNIAFAEDEPSVFVYPSEDSIYEDLESLTSSGDYSSNGTPSPEEQEAVANHVGQAPTVLRNSPSLGSTGALSSYTPSMLSSGESFQLGVSRSAFHQELSKSESAPPVNQDSTPKEELVPADPNETSSWSSSATSDLLF